ncbi:serine/threonine-protein kinase [Singulisphaera sp. Ch08]|uniref:non-specific serine/threonine protein kinase n=1 Tax=Singulisphaera sp. Ch08 TaxID=3120278 RepID=A0AAU7CCA1_9BACT
MRDDRVGDREERLDQVIAGILDEAESEGVEAIDRRRWLVRYPEFFDELSDFFADRDAIEAIAAPLREIAATTDEEWSFDWLAPPDHPDNLGRLGEYEVIEPLGQGGMGVVFKAFDGGLNRYVAIKVLAPQWSSDAGARRRFTREARAAAAVSHPHVITIHAVGEWQARPFLVMEYVTGASLQQRLAESGPLELKELLRIGAQVATGLAAAHAQGLIHRDIKPGNIMLENELARVKITDFGLARAVDDTRLTQHGALAGTPTYMAPEQGRGDRLDRRADLFSLGSVLYAMATGCAAFRGDSTLEVIRRVCDGRPVPIEELNPDIPSWLVEIVERLHAKDPADRFQSADEVADLLGRHLARVQDPSLPFVTHPWARRTRRRSRRIEAWRVTRRLLPVPLLAALVALTSSAGTWWALRSSPGGLRSVPPAATSALLNPARLKQEYHFDFRNERYDHRWLLIEPTDTGALRVKADPRGLRIAIPTKLASRGAGIFTKFGIHGDCEITTTFEVLSAEKTTDGIGSGPELYLRTVDGWSNFVSMYRWVPKDGTVPVVGAPRQRRRITSPIATITRTR